MLLFDASRLAAQLPKPSIFDRAQDRHSAAADAVRAESREQFISGVLLFCLLAAGVYGEILRYGF